MACNVYKRHLLLLDNQAPFKVQGFTVKHLATALRTAALALSMAALPAEYRAEPELGRAGHRPDHGRG